MYRVYEADDDFDAEIREISHPGLDGNHEIREISHPRLNGNLEFHLLFLYLKHGHGKSMV